MGNQLITLDPRVVYQPKEAAIMVMAIGWGVALGTLMLAAYAMCGKKGTKKIDFDWLRLKANVECR